MSKSAEAEDLPAGQGSGSTPKRRRLRISLATLVALVTLATGVLTLRDQLFPNDDPAPPAPAPAASREDVEIQRFEGTARHLADSRALLGFLEQHDHETVDLDVGFPDHLTGPAGGDNVTAETVPFKGSQRQAWTQVTLMTKCDSAVRSEDNPTPADGCTGSSLQIDGPQNEDSYTFFEHGVPRLKGHFAVDYTGALTRGSLQYC